MKNKKSKVQIIKDAFESWRKLTALNAWKLCLSLCLAEIVRHLKKVHKYGDRSGVQDRKRL